MFSPNHTTVVNPIVDTKRNRMIQLLDNIAADQSIRHRHELTQQTLSALDTIDIYPDGNIKEIEAIGLAKSDDLNQLMDSYRVTSQYMYDTLGQLGRHVNRLSAGLMTGLSASRKQSSSLDSLISEIEVQGRSQVTNNAISGEQIIPELFESTNRIQSSTGFIDTIAQRAMMQPTNRVEVQGLRVTGVRVPGNSRFDIIEGPINGKAHDDLFNEGYHFGAFFNGRFEIADHNNNLLPQPDDRMLARIVDGSPQTIFEVEYVTRGFNKVLTVEYDIAIPTQEFVSGILVTLQQELSDWPEVESAVAILEDGTSVSIFDPVETLEVGKFQLSSLNREVRSKGGSIFPVVFIPIQMSNVRAVRLTMSQKRYTVIQIPQNVLLDDRGEIVRTYNYLETYIMNKQTKSTLPDFDPYRTDFNRDVMTDSNSTQALQRNRFAIAIADISLMRWEFANPSTVDIKPTTSQKQIRAVEVYALEDVAGNPDNIQYFITRGDKADRIWPASRPNGTNHRIIFSSLPPGEGEIQVDTSDPVFEVGLRVVMTTTDLNRSPVVKKLAMRLKTD